MGFARQRVQNRRYGYGVKIRSEEVGFLCARFNRKGFTIQARDRWLWDTFRKANPTALDLEQYQMAMDMLKEMPDKAESSLSLLEGTR